MSHIELRTGTPYANLIASQQLFAAAVSDYFDISRDDCIPTPGATGAIEAVRNHVFRTTLKACPTVLTVCPGYWRARESFDGRVDLRLDAKNEPFVIDVNANPDVSPDAGFALAAARASYAYADVVEWIVRSALARTIER